jgi:hypothetical protein
MEDFYGAVLALLNITSISILLTRTQLMAKLHYKEVLQIQPTCSRRSSNRIDE